MYYTFLLFCLQFKKEYNVTSKRHVLATHVLAIAQMENRQKTPNLLGIYQNIHLQYQIYSYRDILVNTQ